jgi:2-methylcitrate dehydratase PrpD
MNPRHYQRGWHCTSTLGALSSAAAAARLLGLDAGEAAHALAIAASSASGLKENFGTMVKPLHAGLAARDGLLAAALARAGLTGSANALDGSQGFLTAFDSEGKDLRAAVVDFGSRWEILETGITVKLYPSCAGTHPTLDAVLDLRAKYQLSPGNVAGVTVEVDPIVPTILIHDRPTTALEAKFSMPFCVAAALVHGAVNLDTFDGGRIGDSRVREVMDRVTMRVDERLGAGRPALTASRVRIRLQDGREIGQEADGARGYPTKPATVAELESKFMGCAGRAIPEPDARRLLEKLKNFDTLLRVSDLFS